MTKSCGCRVMGQGDCEIDDSYCRDGILIQVCQELLDVIHSFPLKPPEPLSGRIRLAEAILLGEKS